MSVLHCTTRYLKTEQDVTPATDVYLPLTSGKNPVVLVWTLYDRKGTTATVKQCWTGS
jgi:predicted acyl esterase